jgi:hypothetical protein
MQQQRSSLAQDIVACDLSVADVQSALRELSTDVMVSEAKVGRGCPLTHTLTPTYYDPYIL